MRASHEFFTRDYKPQFLDFIPYQLVSFTIYLKNQNLFSLSLVIYDLYLKKPLNNFLSDL